MGKKDRQPQAVFSMALFVLMLACVLALTVFGARVYEALTVSRSRNQAARASLAYLAARLRAADESGAVCVRRTEQGDLLILGEPQDNTGYETRIYLYDGFLLEEYSAAGSGPAPESAQQIAETDLFAVEVEEALVRVTTEQGTVQVYLHSGEVTE